MFEKNMDMVQPDMFSSAGPKDRPIYLEYKKIINWSPVTPYLSSKRLAHGLSSDTKYEKEYGIIFENQSKNKLIINMIIRGGTRFDLDIYIPAIQGVSHMETLIYIDNKTYEQYPTAVIKRLLQTDPYVGIPEDLLNDMINTIEEAKRRGTRG